MFKNLLIKIKEFINHAGADRPWRSIVKALTWRIVGTTSLVVLVYIYTGELDVSLYLGAADIISNIILYYLHERIWTYIKWGKKEVALINYETHSRSIAKAFSWRILATSYLVVLSLLITDETVFVATQIAVIDALANLVEYYIHERIWNKIKAGKGSVNIT